jgi:hypothetical protein
MGGGRYIDSHFLDLGISRWLVSFALRSLYPLGKSLQTHWTGSWLGPRAGLDYMEKWQFLTIPGIEFLLQKTSVCATEVQTRNINFLESGFAKSEDYCSAFSNQWWSKFNNLYRFQPTNSVAFSPRANYTDWATATCRRNLVPTFVD